MSEEPEEKIKEAVPVEPEATTPAPEHVPPAVTPDADTKLSDAVSALQEQVNDLTSLVQTLVETGSPQDSTPVSKPWTHRWS